MHHEINGFTIKWSQLTTQLHDFIVRLAILWSPLVLHVGNYCGGTVVVYCNDIHSFFWEILSNVFPANIWEHHKLGLQPITCTYLCVARRRKCQRTHALRSWPVFVSADTVPDQHKNIPHKAPDKRSEPLCSIGSGRLCIKLCESLRTYILL